MIAPPFPPNETERLSTLYTYGILDTPNETTFDEIVRLATYICQTPIALITLVDHNRQWFKAKEGMTVSETPRDIAFCAHTILQAEVLIVPDALADERFANNPLVTSDPHIRFYAGSPLVTAEGYAIGSLSVIDQVPRTLDAEQARSLPILARQVVAQLESRRHLKEMEHLERLKDAFLDTVSHELRTPLTNIRLAIQMLEITLQQTGALEAEPSRIAQYLQILQQECQREIRLIDDLLRLVGLEAGIEPLVLTTIAFQDWLPPVVEPFLERMRCQQQDLQLDIPADLPPFITDLAVLKRIVTELIDNACKYTPAGEAITVSARATAKQLHLNISSAGIELSADEQRRIFDRFYRASSPDPWMHGGTGLGLALVNQLVKQLGGTIKVRSAQNQTTFSVYLSLS